MAYKNKLEDIRMKIRLITPEQYVVSRWAGGSTTQLAIAPDGSLYQNRDFLWRISSASVTQDSSVFTSLNDYDRLICVLQGEMRLKHNDGETITLPPYTVHSFDGGANTLSEGRCVDFNLMVRKRECHGDLRVIMPENGEQTEIFSTETGFAVLIYCRTGSGTVRAEDKCLRLSAEESVLIEEAKDSVIILEGTGVFIAAKMWS